jgi:molecular chaperone HtpG
MADVDPNTQQNFAFQADVSKILHLMVHSVYSEREVFLRELISNAADACDRRRYEALQNPDLLGTETLEIILRIDPQAATLTLEDNGIGMSRQELIEHLGTIAKSGTAKFLELLKEQNSTSPELIGQFGVGFYSAFMVADDVTVTSRRAGSDEAWVWRSNGLGAFDITPGTRASSGTSIMLHLKPDAHEFLEKMRLAHIIRTYSDHITIPIKLGINAEVGETINSTQALWTKPKAEISTDEHTQFYRHLGGLFDTPSRTLHFKAEGRLDYTCLLYTPSQAPHDLYDPARSSKVKLYVKRVFISDDCSHLLPPYLRFLRGVVDAQDLPLNISREMLQNNPVLNSMKVAITKKVLADYAKMAEQDPQAYAAFWAQFGRTLKEGLYEDFEHRDSLLKLARFRSTRGPGLVSLADYLQAMKPEQKAIYVLSTEDKTALTSPQIEGFKARGLEVFLFCDPIDDFWLGLIPNYQEIPFKSITKGESDLQNFATTDAPTIDDTAPPLEPAALDRLIAVFKSVLGDQVRDVRVTDRLTHSPVCLVADDKDLDLRLERLLKTHDKAPATTTRILEINPNHALLKALAAKAGTPGSLAFFEQVTPLLLDQAHLLEGLPIKDPADFAKRLGAVLLEISQQT